MKLKHSVAGAVLIGAAFSGSAFAGVTGNVGAVSEYMFRGVSQSTLAGTHDGGTPAIQGGIDYAHESGLYVGLWGSNVSWGAGNAETDFYGGYSTKVGDIGIDVGAIYYYYAEYKEDSTYASGFKPNTVEGYAKISYGPVALQYYYSPSYYGLHENLNAADSKLKNSYITLIGAFPLTDTLTFNASVGDTLSSGDAWASGSGGSLKKSYIDYNVGLGKAIDPSLSASFSVIGTNLKTGPTLKTDAPKFVVGIKKTFDL